MADADPERPIETAEPVPSRRRHSPWVQGMACLAILPLLGFIGQKGRALWGEVHSLRRERLSVRASEIVGYVDINPNPSYASRPHDWFHDEGDETLIWEGWRENKNHWYRVGRGQIDPKRISMPLGKDVIRAIDYPLFDQEGGTRWAKVPEEAHVMSFEEAGVSIAYPMKVLEKVEVVNDQFGDRPVLVAYTPIDETVAIFEATLDGNRVTLGHGGYFFGQHPILYDRRTNSLWSEQDGAMVAVAGSRKGASLKLISRLNRLTWSDWRKQHPQGKLLIGADRSRPIPAD